MTAVDLDALDKLRGAATPGPWTAATAPSEDSDETHAEYLTNGLRPDEGRPLWVAWAPKVDGVHDGDDVEYVVPVVTGDGPTSEANAAYIAAMHAALPELIAEARKYRALREAVEAVMDRVNTCRGMVTDRPGEARAYDDAGEWIRRALATVDGEQL